MGGSDYGMGMIRALSPTCLLVDGRISRFAVTDLLPPFTLMHGTLLTLLRERERERREREREKTHTRTLAHTYID